MDVVVLVKVLVGWLVIFVALSKVCEKVEEAATHLATRLKLPASVAGATLLAMATGTYAHACAVRRRLATWSETFEI